MRVASLPHRSRLIGSCRNPSGGMGQGREPASGETGSVRGGNDARARTCDSATEWAKFLGSISADWRVIHRV